MLSVQESVKPAGCRQSTGPGRNGRGYERIPASWQYDEMLQIGRDFGDSAEVEAYDDRHGSFATLKKKMKTFWKACVCSRMMS